MHIPTGLYSTITTSEKNRTIHIKQAGAVTPACRFNLYRAILTDCLLFRSTLVCWLFQFTHREYGATGRCDDMGIPKFQFQFTRREYGATGAVYQRRDAGNRNFNSRAANTARLKNSKNFMELHLFQFTRREYGAPPLEGETVRLDQFQFTRREYGATELQRTGIYL